MQRTYWSNLDTLLISDLPSEARLQPALGRLEVSMNSYVPEPGPIDLRIAEGSNLVRWNKGFAVLMYACKLTIMMHKKSGHLGLVSFAGSLRS